MKFWEICKSDATSTVKTFWAGGQKVLSDWQIWRSFMPIRAVEISKKFLIFLFSPPYLDFPPPKPLPSTPQSFFPPFKTFFGTWKKIFFWEIFSFGTFWDFLAKSAKVKLWNLKTSVDPAESFGLATWPPKIWIFLDGTLQFPRPHPVGVARAWSDCLDM